MGNTDKDSDHDYLVLRSRKVPRHPAEYVDAHSGTRDSVSEVLREEEPEKRKREWSRKGEQASQRSKGKLWRGPMGSGR